MKKAAIVACSNGLGPETREQNQALIRFLEKAGHQVAVSRCIYAEDGPFSGTGRQRAEALMQFFEDPEVTDIYDISGGDMANEVLDYLDFEKIGKSPAVFWGYSDLTTVINAIYARTGKGSILYPVRNLVRKEGQALQQRRFFCREELLTPSFSMIQGERMQGIVVGGNIRCFLKLAGTGYFPDVTGKLLLLEARSGSVPQMVTYLSQLRSLGVFEQVGGILLGTFCQMEAEGQDMVSLVQRFAGSGLPLAKTGEIGHGWDSRAICIGKSIEIQKNR